MKYRIALPWGSVLLSANSKDDYLLKARITKGIRVRAAQISSQQEIPAMERVRVRAFYYYPDNRKRDPGNWAPSVKAMIDGGLVDAGVIPDDDDKHLVNDGIHRGYPNITGGQLVLEITPYEESTLTMVERLESLELSYSVILL